MKLPRPVQNTLSKINFALGRNPVIEKPTAWQRFIPSGYQSVCLISADFELAWAWRYSKKYADPMVMAIENARRERQNIPGLLKLFEKYKTPVTWATVGHLFLSSCSSTNGKAHPEIPQLQPFENQFWKYTGSDWFEHDPCTSLEQNPEWYAPDLIKQILSSQVKHEIACHTFSHIDCTDHVCPAEVLENEIKASREAARPFGVELTSFVHPGFTIGNLPLIEKLGFTNFRTDYGNTLGYPEKHGNSLWQLKGTMELAWREGWTAKYQACRYKTIIDRAIKNHSVCVFWFHPSMDKRFTGLVLPEILEHLQHNTNRIAKMTHREYIAFLNKSLKKP